MGCQSLKGYRSVYPSRCVGGIAAKLIRIIEKSTDPTGRLPREAGRAVSAYALGKPKRNQDASAVHLARKQAELPEAYLEVIARDSSGKIVSFQTQKLTGEALNN